MKGKPTINCVTAADASTQLNCIIQSSNQHPVMLCIKMNVWSVSWSPLTYIFFVKNNLEIWSKCKFNVLNDFENTFYKLLYDHA